MRLQLLKINRLFENIEVNSDNFHRIAISNLENPRRKIERWWAKKYGPHKKYEEHTLEELVIEYLEDFYENNPEEITKFLNNEQAQEDWDGQLSPEQEASMQRVWKKKKQIDLSKYKSDIELSEEEEKQLIENLGRNLPPKQVVTKVKDNGEKVLGDEEFDDNFGV